MEHAGEGVVDGAAVEIDAVGSIGIEAVAGTLSAAAGDVRDKEAAVSVVDRYSYMYFVERSNWVVQVVADRIADEAGTARSYCIALEVGCIDYSC